MRRYEKPEHILFQLTTSRRGRRFLMRLTGYPLMFQLTTSRRGRLLKFTFVFNTIVFQLTTSRRGRLCLSHRQHDVHRFNSRPHEEVDIALYFGSK